MLRHAEIAREEETYERRGLAAIGRLVVRPDSSRRGMARTYAFAMADQLWGVYQMIGKL